MGSGSAQADPDPMVEDELAAVVCGENKQSSCGEDEDQGGEPEDTELNLQVVAAEPADKEPEHDGGAPCPQREQSQVFMVREYALCDTCDGSRSLGGPLADEVGGAETDPSQGHQGCSGSIEPKKSAEHQAARIKERGREKQPNREMNDRRVEPCPDGGYEVHVHGFVR